MLLINATALGRGADRGCRLPAAPRRTRKSLSAEGGRRLRFFHGYRPCP